MAQLPPPVAALRLAVRRCLTRLAPPEPQPGGSGSAGLGDGPARAEDGPARAEDGPAGLGDGSAGVGDGSAAQGRLVLVACSGGADSLALAAATAFVAPRLGLRIGLVTVDHGLQAGSAQRAAAVASWAAAAGFAPAEVATVEVAGLPGGPEAAARTARYGALSTVAERLGAAVVLLGHTRDDQAETVLLALARGAGPRGLSGMPYRRGIFVRPLLDVPRSDTRKACAALGLSPWEDPHNSDPAYARSRVRADALPALIAALGPRVVDNLARTATQLAMDNAALDELAVAALARARSAPASPADTDTGPRGASVAGPRAGGTGVAQGGAPLPVTDGVDVGVLEGLGEAVRGRVLHLWARELGASGGALSHRHVAALDALVTDWHGQGATRLPGDIVVARRAATLVRVHPPDM
ncbi:MAG: tRNA(Ile)-lysidine synthase [Actinoplanes sp.]|jgi:tRNA(Ile)-lysidine synthase|nr:tRNA(Ile)-lysidine synthase [Actinoplanes sp.]